MIHAKRMLRINIFHITQFKLIWMNPSSGGCRGSSVFQELGAGQILCTTGSKSAMMLSSRGCREQSTTGWMRMRWATFGRLLYKIRAEQLWCLITDQAMVEWVEQFWYNEQATNFGAWPVLRGAMVGRAKRLYRTQQCWLPTYMIRGYAWSAFSRAIAGWAEQNSKHDEQRLCRTVQRLIHRMSRLCTVQEQSVLEQMSRQCMSRRQFFFRAAVWTTIPTTSPQNGCDMITGGWMTFRLKLEVNLQVLPFVCHHIALD